MKDRKQELRGWIRERKAECPTWERHRISERICQEVMNTRQWQEARTVLLYHALPDEVDTSLLLQETDKRVLLPVVVGDELELHEYDGHTREGAFHILEPTGRRFQNYGQIDLAVIPGMAFDREGHRLGRGKGYYDRLLPLLPQAYRMGICFPFQLLEGVPCEAHDMPMHQVLTYRPTGLR